MAVSSKVVTKYLGADVASATKKVTSKKTAKSKASDTGETTKEGVATDSSKATAKNTGTTTRKTGARVQEVVQDAVTRVTTAEESDTTTRTLSKSDIGVNFAFTLKITSGAPPGQSFAIP